MAQPVDNSGKTPGGGNLRRGNPGNRGGSGRPTKEAVAIRQAAAEAAGLTVESHLAELKLLRDMSCWMGNAAAAVNAEVKRGEVAGFYVKRREDVSKLTPTERAERAAKILKLA